MLSTTDMPGLVTKWLLRTPNALYDAGLGGLLGHRFLQLTHRGRRSGRLHSTVVEVVARDEVTRELTVVSGFGPTANWYRNVLAGGAVEVRVARERWRPAIRQLGEHEAVAALADYEHRNRLAAPIIRIVLSRLTGFRYDGSDEARRRVIQNLPLIALRPAGPV